MYIYLYRLDAAAAIIPPDSRPFIYISYFAKVSQSADRSVVQVSTKKKTKKKKKNKKLLFTCVSEIKIKLNLKCFLDEVGSQG